MSTLPPIDAERTDLSTHVDLCASRYQEVEKRLDSLETKVDELGKKITEVKSDLTKILISTAGTIVVALIGATATIINHIK